MPRRPCLIDLTQATAYRAVRRSWRVVRTEATLALRTKQPAKAVPRSLEKAQQTIIQAVKGVKGRGKGGLSQEQQDALEAAVAVLEADGGVQDPTASPLLGGRWRLLYTTRPGTASPIQRTFTGVDRFSVFQDIELEEATARVNNVVDFGPKVGFLKVEAEASTDSCPIPGFVPRRGSGLPFGILGVSSTDPPSRPNLRVDFQFDRAAFNFGFLPFTVPYPVPFQLLQDERKGWIDITYLSRDGRFRLSRGNKGTLFVLVRDLPPKDRLLEAVAQKGSDAAVVELIEELEGGGRGEAAPARSQTAVGKWRLQWTQQGATANPLQKALSGSVRNYQIIYEGGRLENLVEFAPWLRVRAGAACQPDSAARTGVDIDDVALELGPLKIPLNIRTDGRGFIDWLYLDQDVRVTRGNKGSVFVHTREE